MDVGTNTVKEDAVKVYIETTRTDWSLHRVIHALKRYAPDTVEFVPELDAADLVVKHIIGRRDRNTKEAQYLLEHGQRYAIIQYALRSTLRPETSSWLPLWRGSVLVWSYYNLKTWCAKEWTPMDFNFYYRPLGVDTDIFYPREQKKRFIIGTSGQSAVTEGIRESAFATKRVGRNMLHLGPELRRGLDIICKQDLTDNEVAEHLSQCEFVAGLRRTEGFELMAAEGLMCGARPIFFDRDHYRQWYAPWGVFIPEGSRDEVIDNLSAIFQEGAKPVTKDERTAAAELFDWQRVVAGFWDGCLA